MSKYSLISYKKKGVYNLKTFLKYQKWIKTIYPKDYARDFLISFFPYKLSLAVYTKGLNDKIKVVQKKNGKIYIYGAGRHAIECGHFLDECCIPYQKYIVTNAQGNPRSIRNHPVEQIKKDIFIDSVLIIVAVLTSGVFDVMDTLNKYKNENTDIVVFGE